MDKELIEIIKKQTNVTDELEIEKIYYECGRDVSKTIIKLSKIELEEEKKKHRSIFDDIRDIVDEKAWVYQDFINNLPKNQTKTI